MPTIFARNNADTRIEGQSRANRGFSLSRVIGAMTNENSRLDGYELEVLQEFSRAAGEGYLDPHRVPIPIQLLADPTIRPDRLARTLTVGDAGSALVGTQTMPVVDILRGFSVVTGMGVTVLEVPKNKGINDIVIPKTDGAIQWHWLGDEESELQQEDPTLGKITLSPCCGGVFTKYSRLLARQGSIADALLQREMLGSIGRMIDHTLLNGTGLNGQPVGIVNQAGVNQVGPLPFGYAEALDMEYMAGLAGVRDEDIAFLVNPLDRKILKQRSSSVTALEQITEWQPSTPEMMIAVNHMGRQKVGMLIESGLQGDHIAGRRLRVCRDAPDTKVICGMWPDAVVAMWGVPFLEINPNDPTGFKKGSFEARIVIDIDVGLLHPESWSVHTFDA